LVRVSKGKSAARKKAKPAPVVETAEPAAVVEKAEPAPTIETPVLSFAERAEQRRRELGELKAELTQQIADQAQTQSGDPVTRWLNSTQENDVRAFVASKSTQMNQRKYQMSLIKSFIDDPSRFGLNPSDMPTSTSLPELAERRSELEYRIALIRTFQEILNDELRILKQAEASAQKHGADAKSDDAEKH
jgi:chaperonin cofactor prefoldin